MRADGVVFRRVWQDEKRIMDGLPYFQVMGEGWRDSSGAKERREHLELVKAGARCYR